jgi:hypothetical protein
MSSPSLLKQCETNVVGSAIYFQSLIDLYTSLTYKTSNTIRNPDDETKFRKAMGNVLDVLYKELALRQKDIMFLVGVGSEESQKYAREQANKLFGDDKYSIMYLLEEHGVLPRSWSTDLEEHLRTEAKEALKAKE